MKKEILLHITLVFLTSLLTSECLAKDSLWGSIKMRARESYEFVNLSTAGQEAQYTGLTNTFNLFYEVPMKYSFGLAAGSIFSGLKTSDTPPLGLSDKIKTTFIGFEAKYFPTQAIKGFFIRPGLYWKTLDSQGPIGKVDDFTGGLGLGYEIPVYKEIHLVPEFGTQFGNIGGFDVSIYSFSLALHFYSL